MAKKEKPSAADDLFNSLLEDAHNEPKTTPGKHGPGDFSFEEFSPEESPEEAMPMEEYGGEAPLDYNDKFDNIVVGNESPFDKLDIPELAGQYQSPMDIYGSGSENSSGSGTSGAAEDSNQAPPDNSEVENQAAAPRFAPSPPAEKTFALGSETAMPTRKELNSPPISDVDGTIAVTAFAKKKNSEEPEEKVVVGSFRGSTKASQVFTSVDATLAQAETLKVAQQRILRLERDLEKYRQENDDLASAAEIIKHRSEELESKLMDGEREKNEIREQAQSEMLIMKGHLQFKESELAKARVKVEDLEGRLKSDFKKIRSKERELENRLELARAEKQALIRAKDDHILDQQRKMDQMKAELNNYRTKVFELNKSMDSQNEQIRRTVRALRLALTSLETKNDNIVPIKKAE